MCFVSNILGQIVIIVIKGSVRGRTLGENVVRPADPEAKNPAVGQCGQRRLNMLEQKKY